MKQYIRDLKCEAEKIAEYIVEQRKDGKYKRGWDIEGPWKGQIHIRWNSKQRQMEGILTSIQYKKNHDNSDAMISNKPKAAHKSACGNIDNETAEHQRQREF